MMRRIVAIGLMLVGAQLACAQGLTPGRLGVIFNSDDPASSRVAHYYAERRHIPSENLIGVAVSKRAIIGRDELQKMRRLIIAKLPSEVQSLLLVWSRPYAVECMSITTAMATGFQADFCEPGCALTRLNPLYDTPDWLPADTAGWLPAMLLPSDDETLARAVIDRGIQADGSRPAGTVYLIRTGDRARNVRAAGYGEAEALVLGRVQVRELTTPDAAPPADIIGYFTGVVRVDELSKLTFRPGAAADHLTSTGGALDKSDQMSALDWLRQGATGSYGSVTEPCNHLEKFPNPAVLMNHYLRGDTLLEAYWKSVVMPGQGLFIGEPLARPFTASP